MGSTFSELFYLYFQRAKKRKRKQGGGGIVVVVKLFMSIIKCKVSFSSHSSSSHYSMQGFVFISFHLFGFFFFSCK